VVGAVVVEVLVPHLRAGTDDERRPELGDAAARLVDAVPGGPCAPGAAATAPVRQQAEHAHPPHRSRLRRPGVVVDEHRERHVLVIYEPGGIADAPRSDGDDLGASLLDLVVDAPQLRGVLTAEQSTEVAQEDEDHGPVSPEVPEPPSPPGRVWKLQVSELAEVHCGTL
jgi:hypothetical protein